MKLIRDMATANQTARKSSLGVSSVPLGNFLSGSVSRAISGIRLQSLPPADRGRSSARVRRTDAPIPGPGGAAKSQISRLAEANREWFIWRFGEDA
jgi:hypothetical protein